MTLFKSSILPPELLRRRPHCLGEHAHHFQPVVVHLHILARPPGRTPAGSFSRPGRGRRPRRCVVVRLVEECAFHQLQIVNGRVARLARHTVPAYRAPASAARAPDAACAAARSSPALRYWPARIRKSRSVRPGRRSPPLLQLFFAGRRARVDQHVAHPELFDESKRLLARARADGQHPDHGARRRRRSRAPSAACASSARAGYPRRQNEIARSFAGKRLQALPPCCFLVPDPGLARATTLAFVHTLHHHLALVAPHQLHILRLEPDSART